MGLADIFITEPTPTAPVRLAPSSSFFKRHCLLLASLDFEACFSNDGNLQEMRKMRNIDDLKISDQLFNPVDLFLGGAEELFANFSKLLKLCPNNAFGTEDIYNKSESSTEPAGDGVGTSSK